MTSVLADPETLFLSLTIVIALCAGYYHQQARVINLQKSSPKSREVKIYKVSAGLTSFLLVSFILSAIIESPIASAIHAVFIYVYTVILIIAFIAIIIGGVINLVRG